MSQKPLRIGISACFLYPDSERPYFYTKTLLYAEESTLRWVMGAGGFPIFLPRPWGAFDLDMLVDQIDALVLQGGSDVAPQSYNEQPISERWPGDPIRDEYDIALINKCIEKNVPILALCRGFQILNVALGGTLYQDLDIQNPSETDHKDQDLYDGCHHKATLIEGSDFAKLYPSSNDTCTINSIHHQAVKDLAPGLEIGCLSKDDDIIEAFVLKGGEDPSKPFAVGVQWHPEFIEDNDPNLLPRKPLMDALFEAARARQS